MREWFDADYFVMFHSRRYSGCLSLYQVKHTVSTCDSSNSTPALRKFESHTNITLYFNIYSKDKFSIAIFLPRVLMYQKRQISLPVGVQNRETKNRRLGMIVMSFQDFKQISQSCSYCELTNSLRNSTIVR